MKVISIVAATVVLAGCASTAAIPTGMKPGQFVQFSCQSGKSFSARLREDAQTIRVRYEGGWELDQKADGVYESDGWKLMTTGPNAIELLHNGKSIGKQCKAGA